MKHCRLCDNEHRKGRLCQEARRVYNYKQGLKWARERLKDDPEAQEVLNRVLCGGPVERKPLSLLDMARALQSGVGRYSRVTVNEPPKLVNYGITGDTPLPPEWFATPVEERQMPFRLWQGKLKEVPGLNPPPGFTTVTAGDIARKFREATPHRQMILSLTLGGNAATWGAMDPNAVVCIVAGAMSEGTPPPGEEGTP